MLGALAGFGIVGAVRAQPQLGHDLRCCATSDRGLDLNAEHPSIYSKICNVHNIQTVRVMSSNFALNVVASLRPPVEVVFFLLNQLRRFTSPGSQGLPSTSSSRRLWGLGWLRVGFGWPHPQHHRPRLDLGLPMGFDLVAVESCKLLPKQPQSNCKSELRTYRKSAPSQPKTHPKSTQNTQQQPGHKPLAKPK